MPEATAPPAAVADPDPGPVPVPGPSPSRTGAHPSCRARRSATQTRMYGRTPEFAPEHRKAAAIQAQHRHAVVWFGEATQSYWAATPTGLTEAPDTDTLLLTLWARTTPARVADPATPDPDPGPPAGSPRNAETAGAAPRPRRGPHNRHRHEHNDEQRNEHRPPQRATVGPAGVAASHPVWTGGPKGAISRAK